MSQIQDNQTLRKIIPRQVALVTVPIVTRTLFWSSLYYFGPIGVVTVTGWGPFMVVCLAVHGGIIDTLIAVVL